MTLYGFLWITVKVRYVIVLAFQDVCSVVKNQYSVIPLLCIRIWIVDTICQFLYLPYIGVFDILVIAVHNEQ